MRPTVTSGPPRAAASRIRAAAVLLLAVVHGLAPCARCAEGPSLTPERLEKGVCWERSAEEASLWTPRKWVFLGPCPEARRLFRETLEPDKTDNWQPPPKDPSGKPFASRNWTRGPDDVGDYVNLREALEEPGPDLLAFALAEVAWPSEDIALLHFECDGFAALHVNGKPVFVDEARADRGRGQASGPERRLIIPVALKQGVN
jgi:hypothetical protein